MATNIITAINQERILWCCQDLGITLDDLAREKKISISTLEHAEEKGLSYRQLTSIAKYFNRGVLFFLEEHDVVESKAHSVQFRTVANRKNQIPPKVRKLIDLAEKKRELYLSLLDDLGEDTVSFTPPEYNNESQQEFYKEVLGWLDLPENRDFDTYRKIIEGKGVLVIRSNGYNGVWQVPKDSEVMGFSLYYEKLPVIFVKKCDHPARQVFTLFHELGHLIIHKSSYMDDQSDLETNHGYEKEANSFAGNILVPNTVISMIERTEIPDSFEKYKDWLQPWTKGLGISADAILIRLTHMGLVDSSLYNEYKQWQNNNLKNKISKKTIPRKYRNREPLHIFGDGYVRAVFDAKNMHKISLNKASDYLDRLAITDLKKLEAHLVST